MVVSGPTGGVDGPYRTLTVQMSDPNTFGLRECCPLLPLPAGRPPGLAGSLGCGGNVMRGLASCSQGPPCHPLLTTTTDRSNRSPACPCAAVLQYWFSATNKATLKTITGYNDVVSAAACIATCAGRLSRAPPAYGAAQPVRPRAAAAPRSTVMHWRRRPAPGPYCLQADGSTVTLSSAVAAFKAVMCTNADVTWINMEVWVVTEAGAGDKTAIATEAYTTACAP